MHASQIPRDELFFTTKVPARQINYQGAKSCIDETLKKTNLGYVDLYLLHAPYGGKEGRLGAWKALVEGVEEGKIRSIGVSNFGVHHLDELEQWQKDTEVKEGKGKGGVLSVNQIELHPWLARPDIVQWCEKRGVLLEVRCMTDSLRLIADRHRHTLLSYERLGLKIRFSYHWRRSTARLHHRFFYDGACRRYTSFPLITLPH